MGTAVGFSHVTVNDFTVLSSTVSFKFTACSGSEKNQKRIHSSHIGVNMSTNVQGLALNQAKKITLGRKNNQIESADKMLPVP